MGKLTTGKWNEAQYVAFLEKRFGYDWAYKVSHII